MGSAFQELVEGWDGEQVAVRYDAELATWMFIAVHSTRLGRAGGGTRMRVYDRPEDGLADALLLSGAMTRKFAVCDVPRGGGKGVLAVPRLFEGAERIELLHRYGDFISSLGGLYATAPDMNTSERDMDVIAERCEYVFCRSGDHGGSGSHGAPRDRRSRQTRARTVQIARRRACRGTAVADRVRLPPSTDVGPSQASTAVAFAASPRRVTSSCVTRRDIGPATDISRCGATRLHHAVRAELRSPPRVGRGRSRTSDVETLDHGHAHRRHRRPKSTTVAGSERGDRDPEVATDRSARAGASSGAGRTPSSTVGGVRRCAANSPATARRRRDVVARVLLRATGRLLSAQIDGSVATITAARRRLIVARSTLQCRRVRATPAAYAHSGVDRRRLHGRRERPADLMRDAQVPHSLPERGLLAPRRAGGRAMHGRPALPRCCR